MDSPARGVSLPLVVFRALGPKGLRLFAFLSFLFFVPGAFAQSDEGGSTNRVAEVRVEGNRRTEAEQVLLLVRTRAGEPIDRETIARDVKDLYALGLYSDIAVDVQRGAEGYIVTFRVTERPAVAEVEIEGEDEIDEEKIREKLALSVNTVFTEAKLEETRLKIVKLYEEEGYYLADVQAVREFDREKNNVKITFKIEENDEVKVRRIEFVGNESFSDEELKNLEFFATKEGGVFSGITGDGKFQEEALEQDIQVVTLHYLDHGYLQIKVEKPIVTLSRDRKDIFITIPLVEGPRFTVRKVEVQGDLLWPAEELVASLKTKPGEFFSRKTVLADAESLSNRYADESYAFANVDPIPHPDQEGGKHLVDLVFAIDKGVPVSIERILIVGNFKTRDKVIRREMKIAEGAKYNRSKLEESKRRIQRLGFFDKITYAPEKVPGSRDRVNVRFEVTERPTGSIQVGAGYSSLESFFAQASISQANLFGRGQRLELQAQVGGRVQSASITFRDPRVFDTYWDVSVSAFSMRRADAGFDTARDGGRLGVGYELTEFSPLLENVSASVTLSGQHIRLLDLSSSLENDNVPVNFVNRDSVTTSISFSISHDTLNDLFDPTDGTRHTARLEFADNIFFIGRDTNDFLRYRLTGDYFFPMPADFVFILKWDLGLFDRREKSDILFQERFRGGGIANLRGYSPQSVGFYRRGNINVPYNMGGDKELYFTSEVLVPLLQEARLKLALFADAGGVYSDQDALLNYILADVGFGIRWFSPLGPIRFEFGWPLVQNEDYTGRDKVSGPVFSLSIGQFF
ncbi:MAG: outer membrane protein assembly factor BamA [Bdellovibrionota bacterium]